VEDWEEFFVEKSRRRFDRAEHERRLQQTRTAITVALLVLLVVLGIVGLEVLP
jgi:hypothetical protein